MRGFQNLLLLLLLLSVPDALAQTEFEILSFEEEFISGVIKNRQRPEEAPSSFFLIPREKFETFNFISIGDALFYVPGVWGIYDWTIYNFGLRGIHGGPKAGSRIFKVMLDSEDYIAFRPSAEVLLGPEFIPTSFVKTVEVVKGPASALYGANAFVGVVNVTTREPDEMDPFYMKLFPGFFGSGKNFQGGFEVSGAKVFELGNVEVPFAVGIYYFRQRRDGLTFGPRSLAFSELVSDPNLRQRMITLYRGKENENDLLQTLSVFSKGGVRFSKFRIDLKGIFQGLSSSAQFSDYGQLIPQNTISIWHGGGSAKLSGDLKISGWTITPSIYSGVFLSRPFEKRFLFFKQDRKVIRYGEGVETYVRRFSSTAFDGKVEVSARKGGNLVLVGADLINDVERIESVYRVQGQRLVLEAKPERETITFRNIGYYGQVYLLPVRRVATFGDFSVLGLGFLAGARFDDHNIYEDVFNTRVGAVVIPLRSRSMVTYVKGIFGTSFRAPSPEQLFIVPVRPGDFLGNPELKPEKARIFEIIAGGTFELFPFARKLEVKPEFSLYRITVIDAIKFSKEGGFVKPVNQPLQISQGFDVGLSLSWWFSEFSIYYSRVRVVSIFEELGERKVFLNEFFPEHIVVSNLSVGAEVLGIRLSIGALFRYVSRRNVPDVASELLTGLPDAKLYQPPYSVFGISLNALTHSIGYSTRFFLRVENVFNQKYWEPGFRGLDIPGTPFWLVAGTEFIL